MRTTAGSACRAIRGCWPGDRPDSQRAIREPAKARAVTRRDLMAAARLPGLVPWGGAQRKRRLKVPLRTTESSTRRAIRGPGAEGVVSGATVHAARSVRAAFRDPRGIGGTQVRSVLAHRGRLSRTPRSTTHGGSASPRRGTSAPDRGGGVVPARSDPRRLVFDALEERIASCWPALPAPHPLTHSNPAHSPKDGHGSQRH